MQSLQIILEMKPKVIYPGHGPVIRVTFLMFLHLLKNVRNENVKYPYLLTQDPIEKIEFYIKHRNQREEQILEVLNSNRNQTFTPMDVVKIIYKVSTYIRLQKVPNYLIEIILKHVGNS